MLMTRKKLGTLPSWRDDPRVGTFTEKIRELGTRKTDLERALKGARADLDTARVELDRVTTRHLAGDATFDAVTAAQNRMNGRAQIIVTIEGQIAAVQHELTHVDEAETKVRAAARAEIAPELIREYRDRILEFKKALLAAAEAYARAMHVRDHLEEQFTEGYRFRDCAPLTTSSLGFPAVWSATFDPRDNSSRLAYWLRELDKDPALK